MIDIHLLKVFIAVYKHKSFTRASEEIFLSQPTISEHIKTLERLLGCKLFDRIGKKVLPTSYASLLYDKAVEIVDNTKNLKNIVSNFDESFSGKVVLGASSIPSTYILPVIFSDLRKKYQSITFEVISMDSHLIIKKVFTHEIILGLVGTQTNEPDLDFIPFTNDEIVLISSPYFLKKNVISLSELKEIPLIIREYGSGTLTELKKNLINNGFNLDDFNVVAEFGSNEAIKEAVINGLGVSFVSSFSIYKELSCKMLKAVDIKNLKISRHFYIVKHKKRTFSPIYDRIIDLLKAGLFKTY